MPTTIPALRGNFGSTEYWITTMNIGEFVRNVQFPQDLSDWDDLSIEEKYQREINLRRVRNEIAPYFATDPDRFSGSLVLAVINDDEMTFEALPKLGGGGNPPALSKRGPRYGILDLAGYRSTRTIGWAAPR